MMHRMIAITTVVIATVMLSFACGDDTAPVVVEKVVEVEVPVEVVVEKEVPVEVVVEVIKEVPVEIVVEREVIKEVPVEVVVEKAVVKEVPVEVVVEKEVPVEVVVEVFKEVPVEVVVEKEVIKEVPVEVVVEKIVEVEVAAPTPTPEDTGSIETDRAALVALYNATDGPNWYDSDNWLGDMPLGEWYAVTTDSDGRVTRLNLREKPTEW